MIIYFCRGLRVRVIAGDHSIRNADSSEQSLRVERMVVHPNYNSQTNENDFAILKLSSLSNTFSSLMNHYLFYIFFVYGYSQRYVH